MIKSEQIHSHFLQILAFDQNWTCKHNVGHCDLTLLCFFFFFFFKILNTKVQLMFQSNPIISNGSGEKIDFDGFTISSNGGHLRFLA